VKDAKAAQTRAKADAKSERESREAGSDVRNAEYKAAVERCDALAGDAKDRCVANARGRFGVR
jgi:hypothetical protein